MTASATTTPATTAISVVLSHRLERLDRATPYRRCEIDQRVGEERAEQHGARAVAVGEQMHERPDDAGRAASDAARTRRRRPRMFAAANRMKRASSPRVRGPGPRETGRRAACGRPPRRSRPRSAQGPPPRPARRRPLYLCSPRRATSARRARGRRRQQVDAEKDRETCNQHCHGVLRGPCGGWRARAVIEPHARRPPQ